MFNPGSSWFATKQSPKASPPSPSSLSLDDSSHDEWQALVRGGQVVSAIKLVREQTNLDLAGALALVNDYREKNGLMPVKKSWWRRVFFW